MTQFNLKNIFFLSRFGLKRSFRFLFSKACLFVVSLLILSFWINKTFLFEPLKGQRWLSKVYKKSNKKTLQRVDGPLIEYDMDVRVLKIKQKDKIYLEFLAKQPDNSFILINSVRLRGSRDGYFTEWKEDPSSLWLNDYTKDGHLDVVAPTFDKFFRPQPNLVVYNKETKKFELKVLSDYPEIISRPSNAP